MIRVFLNYRGDSIELQPGENLVGRAISCRIRFNDPAVSRQHLRFWVEEKKVEVEDLSTINGSRINGEELKGKHQLVDGDELQIGHRWLTVKIFANEAPFWDEATDTHSMKLVVPKEVQNHFYTVAAERTEASTKPITGHLTPIPAALGLSCPKCQKIIAADAQGCPQCGFRWGQHRAAAVTQAVLPIPVVPTKDRRNEPRQLVDMPILYVSDMLTFDAVARDLSIGGMFINTDLVDPEGTCCYITALPEGCPAISLAGRVCHAITKEEVANGHLPGMGIQFTQMGDDARHWLSKYVLTPHPIRDVE